MFLTNISKNFRLLFHLSKQEKLFQNHLQFCIRFQIAKPTFLKNNFHFRFRCFQNGTQIYAFRFHISKLSAIFFRKSFFKLFIQGDNSHCLFWKPNCGMPGCCCYKPLHSDLFGSGDTLKAILVYLSYPKFVYDGF